MIAKAFMAILNAITSFVMSIIPDIPVIPSFVVTSLTFMTDLMVGSAGMIKYVLGDLVYSAALDYIVLLFTYKIFIRLFQIIKEYILMR